MHTSQKIAALQQRLGDTVQVYRRKKMLCVFNRVVPGWWLWIEDQGDYYRIFRASAQTYHSREFGKSFAADFQKATGERQLGPDPFKGAWESALTMHPIKDENRAKEIFDLVTSEIDAAYQYHLGTIMADEAA